MTEYTAEDIKRMNISALACNKSRLKELIDFAKLSGYHKLGIANCFFMQKYACLILKIYTERCINFCT